jgi:hypothetical protein
LFGLLHLAAALVAGAETAAERAAGLLATTHGHLGLGLSSLQVMSQSAYFHHQFNSSIPPVWAGAKKTWLRISYKVGLGHTEKRTVTHKQRERETGR